MQESWIDLVCPECTHHWQDAPSDLPAPESEVSCPGCGDRRPIAEFTQTQRDFEILENFHSG